MLLMLAALRESGYGYSRGRAYMFIYGGVGSNMCAVPATSHGEWSMRLGRAILISAFLTKVPHFFAYLCTITKASRTFESSAWASYDMTYRRQAANRGSLDWGIVDPALYNEAFAGRAKPIPRCKYRYALISGVPPRSSGAGGPGRPGPDEQPSLPAFPTPAARSSQGRGAVSHSAAMHTCAPSADGSYGVYTVRGASNPPPPAVCRLPLRPRADRPHPLGSSAVLS